MTGEVDRKSSSRPTLIQRIDFYEPAGTYGAFSNFFETPITIDGLIYPTVEHYFQTQKFLGPISTPRSQEYSQLVAAQSTPNKANQQIKGGYKWVQDLNAIIQHQGDQMTGSFHKEVINDKTVASTPSKKAFQSRWTEMNRLLRRRCRCRYDRPSRVLLNIEDVSKESHLEFRSNLLTCFRSLSGDVAHEL